ncbi:hypothetical protein METP3_02657 [Methanosarcinales archaeon]|nr:hypothetical protein METP3_02657 [Methanosarcinales archaeon]
MQTYFWLSGAAGTMRVGAWGCAMGAPVCDICGFIYSCHCKVRKGRKDFETSSLLFCGGVRFLRAAVGRLSVKEVV